MLTKRRRRKERRAAVTVEFAVVAPIFLIILLGVAEASRLYDQQNQLSIAAREGARLAAMDRSDLLEDGQSTNDKIIDDVKNMLAANGITNENIEVKISHIDDADEEFDLDDPDNYLELFQLRIELPYGSSNPYGVPASDEMMLGASVVFRNARTSLVN